MFRTWLIISHLTLLLSGQERLTSYLKPRRENARRTNQESHPQTQSQERDGGGEFALSPNVTVPEIYDPRPILFSASSSSGSESDSGSNSDSESDSDSSSSGSHTDSSSGSSRSRSRSRSRSPDRKRRRGRSVSSIDSRDSRRRGGSDRRRRYSSEDPSDDGRRRR